MTRQDRARERLAEQMDERRLDLGMSWQAVARAAGLSPRTLQDIRSGAGTPRRDTLRKIDAALAWIPGSAETALAGGDPRPRSGSPEAEQLRREAAAMSADERAHALALADILRDLRPLREA
jgi:transcriptional regulator with XRE-family HTH domain